MLAIVATSLALIIPAATPTPSPRRTPGPPSAPARPAPKATAAEVAPPAAVPFTDGERATYNVSWSSMSAGTASIVVRAGRNASGIDSWTAQAEIVPSAMLSKLYTLAYKAESTFDARTLLPRTSLVDGLEGGRRRIRRTVFDQARKKAQYSVTIGDTLTRSINIAAESQDVLSIVYKIRTLPLAPGFTQSIALCDNGRRYTFEVSVAEVTTLNTLFGATPAFKIAPRVVGEDGAVEPSQKTLWFSADDRRVLLRAESTLAVGRVILELSK